MTVIHLCATVHVARLGGFERRIGNHRGLRREEPAAVRRGAPLPQSSYQPAVIVDDGDPIFRTVQRHEQIQSLILNVLCNDSFDGRPGNGALRAQEFVADCRYDRGSTKVA